MHYFIFFFTATATTEIYTLSLHDALPISRPPHKGMSSLNRAPGSCKRWLDSGVWRLRPSFVRTDGRRLRSEEHTSELQSHHDLVCRLLLEKKKQLIIQHTQSLNSCRFCHS